MRCLGRVAQPKRRRVACGGYRAPRLEAETSTPKHCLTGWRVLLGDLGVGVGFLPQGIDENGVLLGQLTRMGTDEDVRSQVSIYVAPEVLGGQPATAKSDIYALGVLTYQLVVGDLRRALAPGWHHDIENRWLREDIELAANVSPDRRAVSAERLQIACQP